MINKRSVGRPKVTVDVDRAKLRRLRLEMGLFQKDIAEAIGYSEARITQFETGSAGGVPIDALKQIAEILGVNHTELLLKETNHEAETFKD